MPDELRALILAEKPHFIVPEIEAIATQVLVDIEQEGLVRSFLPRVP
jgi:phosphoribosylglycinamide formyltransferase 2